MKLKLNTLNAQALRNKEMNNVRGGGKCCCGCLYANQGGSSSADNTYANDERGLKSPGYDCMEEVVIYG